MYMLSVDFNADAPRRQAAAEWRDWTEKVSAFIPVMWAGLRVPPFEIEDKAFTKESGYIKNGTYCHVATLLHADIFSSVPFLSHYLGSYEAQLRKDKLQRGHKKTNKPPPKKSTSEYSTYAR